MSAATPRRIETHCCIAGGGPAGMMAGLLLARAGVDVLVLEKHADFLRDFRGDTVHPSTLELMHELGLLEAFLAEPHQEVPEIRAVVGGSVVTLADFRHLPVACPFVALMPQWNFLDFLARHARKFPTFRLSMESEVEDVLVEAERVVGVRVSSTEGPLEVRAMLTIGADGRSSRVREAAGLQVHDHGAPIDVFWLRLSRRDGEAQSALGRIDAGRFFVMLDRGDYWQCAYVIPKGSADQRRQRGIAHFRDEISKAAPELSDRVHELRDWDDVKLLSVKVDRLEHWCRTGLLMIGDAAHAMSPIGGVGINLAIQDAVATANLISEPLYAGRLTLADLRKVQRRRELPTRLTQAAQVFLQDHVLTPVLASAETLQPPFPLRLLNAVPWLRRIPARFIGLGARPEHVRSAQRSTAQALRSKLD